MDKNSKNRPASLLEADNGCGGTGTVRISWYTVTDCLGPGKRFAIWVQGCKKSCAGCIAEGLRDINGGSDADIGELSERVILSGAEGITISGGEPFLQAEALCALVEGVRKERPGTGVIVYTGMTYEELCGDPSASGLLSVTDLLIDGEYRAELDDGRAMRGSSNQRLIFLTDRYSEEDMPRRRKDRLIFSGDGFRMIGIPSDGARKALEIFSAGKEQE